MLQRFVLPCHQRTRLDDNREVPNGYGVKTKHRTAWQVGDKRKKTYVTLNVLNLLGLSHRINWIRCMYIWMKNKITWIWNPKFLYSMRMQYIHIYIYIMDYGCQHCHNECSTCTYANNNYCWKGPTQIMYANMVSWMYGNTSHQAICKLQKRKAL